MVRTLLGGAIGLAVAWFAVHWAAGTARDFRVLVGLACVVGATCGARVARATSREQRRAALITGAFACLVICLAILALRSLAPY